MWSTIFVVSEIILFPECVYLSFASFIPFLLCRFALLLLYKYGFFCLLFWSLHGTNSVCQEEYE